MTLPATQTEPLLETSDIQFVAFARLRGVGEQTLKQEGGRVFFCFANPLGALMKEYLQGGTVPARRYAEELSALKHLVHLVL